MKDIIEKKYFDNYIVEEIPSAIFTKDDYACLRSYAIDHMGFSVVTVNNCKILKKIIGSESVLEVMCGLGAYTATLRYLDVKCIATDDMSWYNYETSKYRNWNKRIWIEDIEQLDAVESIKKYCRDVGFVLMSWPPQNEPSALQVLEEMRKVNQKCRMIYIGESKGGCNANDLFFDSLADVSHDYVELDELRRTYHSWSNNGYYDQQYILR